MISLINFNLVKNIPAQRVEVTKTFGSNKKLLSIIGKFEFTDFDLGLKKTYSWFLKYKKYLVN